MRNLFSAHFDTEFRFSAAGRGDGEILKCLWPRASSITRGGSLSGWIDLPRRAEVKKRRAGGAGSASQFSVGDASGLASAWPPSISKMHLGMIKRVGPELDDTLKCAGRCTSVTSGELRWAMAADARTVRRQGQDPVMALCHPGGRPLPPPARAPNSIDDPEVLSRIPKIGFGIRPPIREGGIRSPANDHAGI